MSKIALRLAIIAIGTAAFASGPALAAHKAKKASDQTPNYTSVTRWDHGKKYIDYMGAPPAAPTQQELDAKRQAAAQKYNLHAVTRLDHGKPVYDYTGTLPSAPSQQELATQQEEAAKAHHLRGVTRWDHGKKYVDYQ